MSKLAPAIAWLKRNKFWLGSIFLSLLAVGAWYTASEGLDTQRAKSEQEIKSRVSSLTSVRSVSAEEGIETPVHPNQATEAGMNQEIEDTIDGIVEAWKMRYEDQQKILTWPRDIFGEETCDFFERVDTPEKFNPNNQGAGFERFLANFYNEVPREMVKICDMIRTNWKFDPDAVDPTTGMPGMGFDGMMMMDEMMMGGMAMGGGSGSEAVKNADGLTLEDLSRIAVVWDETNQQLWQQKLTEFQGYDDHRGPTIYPTPLQAYMLQQDLWLLEAMFANIRAINGGANANDLATIKRLDHVVFGREARTQLGEIAQIDKRLALAKSAQGIVGEMAYGEAMQSYGDGSTDGTGTAFDINGHRIPYHGRYVDPSFEPIGSDEVFNVIAGNTMPAANLELIVAKRVPFRIAVKMDERKIPAFIAQCANSAFVFEVNQVRINTHIPSEGIEFNGGITSNATDAGSSGMGGMGMGMGMDMSYSDPSDDMYMMEEMMGGMGMGGMGMGGGTSQALKQLESTPVESRVNFDVNVEFYGIVKIYNPVREDFLRKAAGQEVGNDAPVDVPVDPNESANRNSAIRSSSQALASTNQP